MSVLEIFRLFKITKGKFPKNAGQTRIPNPNWRDAPGRFFCWEADAYRVFTIGPEPISSAPMQLNVLIPSFSPADKVTSVDLRVTHNGTPVVHSLPPTQTSFEINNPPQGTYAFAVRGNNVVGAGSFGASTNITNVPATPPAPEVVVVP
jgi:hypothetical protein